MAIENFSKIPPPVRSVLYESPDERNNAYLVCYRASSYDAYVDSLQLEGTARALTDSTKGSPADKRTARRWASTINLRSPTPGLVRHDQLLPVSIQQARLCRVARSPSKNNVLVLPIENTPAGVGNEGVPNASRPSSPATSRKEDSESTVNSGTVDVSLHDTQRTAFLSDSVTRRILAVLVRSLSMM